MHGATEGPADEAGDADVGGRPVYAAGLRVLRRLQRLLPPPRLALTIDDHASPAELVGRPGTITLFEPNECAVAGSEGVSPLRGRAANVCCPGCGENVFYNDGREYELVGPRDRLSIMKPLWFRCCGWRGRLADGWWVGRRAA